MSETDINKMDFKTLRKEVQLIKDELAIMKRKYEDAIYNLDRDNFSKSFTIEHDNMKTQVKITADSIKTMVSNTDLENALSEYSTIEQTANAITSTVNGTYVKTLIGDEYVSNATFESKIQQTSQSILSTVSATYETQDGAAQKYSEIQQTATIITTKVSDLENFKTSVFTQTVDGFTLDGEKTTFTGVIYLTDNLGNKKFAFTHDESQGYNFVSFRGIGRTIFPIVIGDSNYGNPNVYIGGTANSDRVATRGWVESNSVAVFG